MYSSLGIKAFLIVQEVKCQQIMHGCNQTFQTIYRNDRQLRLLSEFCVPRGHKCSLYQRALGEVRCVTHFIFGPEKAGRNPS